MRVQRIIARQLARKRFTLKKQMEKRGILGRVFNHAYVSGIETNQRFIEQSTKDLSYDVEVGGPT